MDSHRLHIFLHSLEPDSPALLQKMEEYAAEHHVPVVRPEMAALLRTLVELKQPDRILEVGCAIGYSALQMARVMPAAAEILTIEQFAPRIPVAREFFRLAGEEGRITLLEGDAAEILPGLDGPFDFVFMDAAKGQYLQMLPQVMRLLTPGGVLVTDNILQGGTLLDSRYAVPRRDRTIHRRLREYLYQLKHCDELETSVLPVGDGAAVSVRRHSR